MTFTRSIPAQGATLVLLALSAVGSTHATEGGTSMYPNGIENHMSGALPPPGLYGIVYGNHYKATQVNDNSGNSLNIPGFKVEADVLAARLQSGQWGVVIGHEMARVMGVTVGDPLTVVAPSGQVTPAGVVPRLKQVTVVGVFNAGHYEYDSGLVLMHK